MMFILAGQLSHAHLVANYLGLYPSEWTYLHREMQLKGYQNPTIYVYDTAEQLEGFNDIAGWIEAAGANVIIITEDMTSGIPNVRAIASLVSAGVHSLVAAQEPVTAGPGG